MEIKKFVEELNQIEMPTEMQERIIRNCYMKMEENKMNKQTTKKFFEKPMAAVAAFALCFCLTGVTALAATGKLEDFFKDIKRWDGAVIGTSYEQATDEIELAISSVSDELTIEMTMVKPDDVPYSTFEMLGIQNYKIVDTDGEVIVEDVASEMADVVDGKVNVNISLDNVSNGEYKLIISELVGSSKADQPLVLSGTWECGFEK